MVTVRRYCRTTLFSRRDTMRLLPEQYWQFITQDKVKAKVMKMRDQRSLTRRRASVELVTMNQHEYGQLYSRAVRVLSPDLDDDEVDELVRVR